MLYEIVNMSDPYTIEANSLDVAFVACALLGNGQYAFEPIEQGVHKIPMFLFGGCETWCKNHFQKTVKEIIDQILDPQRCKELADCLDSCLIGHAVDRQTYFTGLALIDDPAKKEQWRLEWHDKRRSSMNDIGGRAHEMAIKLREGASNPAVPAPPQVFGG